MFIAILLITVKIWGKNQMSFSRWIAKQTVVHLYCGILYSDKKEWTIDTPNNLDDSRKYTEWKRPIPKGYILYDTIYIIFLKL